MKAQSAPLRGLSIARFAVSAFVLVSALSTLVGLRVAAADSSSGALTLSVKISGKSIPEKSKLENYFVSNWKGSSKINSGVLQELVSIQLQYLSSKPSWVVYILNITDADALYLYAHYEGGRWKYVKGTSPLGDGRPTSMPLGTLKRVGVSVSWTGSPTAVASNLRVLLKQSNVCQTFPTVTVAPSGGGSRSVDCPVTGSTSLIVGIEVFTKAKSHSEYLRANSKSCAEAAMIEDQLGYGIVNSANWTALAPIADVQSVADAIGGTVLWPKTRSQVVAVQRDYPNGCS